jgi:hypothetical protein
MLKRIAIFAVAAIGLTAAPVAAQQYPPEEKTIAASDTTPCPGGATTITGEGFDAGSTVQLTLDGTTSLGSATVGDDGTFSVEVTIPETTATGEHTVSATGTGIDAAITATLEVVSCEAPATTTTVVGGALPRTGSNSTMPLVRAGLALTAIGGVLLAVAAKRRRRTAVA